MNIAKSKLYRLALLVFFVIISFTTMIVLTISTRAGTNPVTEQPSLTTVDVPLEIGTVSGTTFTQTSSLSPVTVFAGESTTLPNYVAIKNASTDTLTTNADIIVRATVQLVATNTSGSIIDGLDLSGVYYTTSSEWDIALDGYAYYNLVLSATDFTSALIDTIIVPEDFNSTSYKIKPIVAVEALQKKAAQTSMTQQVNSETATILTNNESNESSLIVDSGDIITYTNNCKVPLTISFNLSSANLKAEIYSTSEVTILNFDELTNLYSADLTLDESSNSIQILISQKVETLADSATLYLTMKDATTKQLYASIVKASWVDEIDANLSKTGIVSTNNATTASNMATLISDWISYRIYSYSNVLTNLQANLVLKLTNTSDITKVRYVSLNNISANANWSYNEDLGIFYYNQEVAPKTATSKIFDYSTASAFATDICANLVTSDFTNYNQFNLTISVSNNFVAKQTLSIENITSGASTNGAPTIATSSTQTTKIVLTDVTSSVTASDLINTFSKIGIKSSDTSELLVRASIVFEWGHLDGTSWTSAGQSTPLGFDYTQSIGDGWEEMSYYTNYYIYNYNLGTGYTTAPLISATSSDWTSIVTAIQGLTLTAGTNDDLRMMIYVEGSYSTGQNISIITLDSGTDFEAIDVDAYEALGYITNIDNQESRGKIVSADLFIDTTETVATEVAKWANLSVYNNLNLSVFIKVYVSFTWGTVTDDVFTADLSQPAIGFNPETYLNTTWSVDSNYEIYYECSSVLGAKSATLPIFTTDTVEMSTLASEIATAMSNQSGKSLKISIVAFTTEYSA